MINYVFDIDAGGIFSKYMFGVQNAIKHEFDSMYLNITDNRTISNAFDFVLDQKIETDSYRINCENLGTYDKINTIENSPNFNNYKELVKKIKIKQTILDKVDEYVEKLNITEKTIGVHLRLTDMNIHHIKQYGSLSFENFLSNMDTNKDYFIASDNHESIEKLKQIFGDKIKYIPNMIRCERETDDSTLLQIDNFKNEQFWVEAFIEMLILSKCNKIICRTSNLINASIVHSNNINEIIRL
jgi:hypothetical protein